LAAEAAPDMDSATAALKIKDFMFVSRTEIGPHQTGS
jgi:hypothetical protein